MLTSLVCGVVFFAAFLSVFVGVRRDRDELEADFDNLMDDEDY